MIKQLLFFFLTINSCFGEQLNENAHNKMKNIIDQFNEQDQSTALSISGHNQIIINKIEDYLNRITTLSADFIQIDPEGNEANGKLYLSRPGKLRWQYELPTPTLIVVKNNLITYYDYELEQESHASAKNNLAAFLARPKIELHSDVKIHNFIHKAGYLQITMVKKQQSNDGMLSLIFNEVPIALKKIELTDAAGQLTSVTLHNIKQGIKLDDQLFIFKNPKLLKSK